jgi:xanthine dehydrogenase accessory factor
VKRALLAELLGAWREKRPVVLATEHASGAQRLLGPGATGLSTALAAALGEALARDACRTHEEAGERLFLQPFNPPLRLVIVGAVHVAQPLAAMAALAEYAVTIVDPRSAFATPARFPGVALDPRWPDAALRALALDARTALVALTHDPKLDDPALHVALRSPAFYVGALGSKRTHAARAERLRAAGFGEAEIARLHAPVGLDISARSPAEIAVSILAEITRVLRAGAR